MYRRGRKKAKGRVRREEDRGMRAEECDYMKYAPHSEDIKGGHLYN